MQTLDRPTIESLPPSPEQVLALDARALAGLLLQPDRQPRRWSSARFIHELALIGAHLRPIRSRSSLAASFGREAFHVSGTRISGLASSAVRVAYAARWIELEGSERQER
jgi:hypothetical protein